MEAEQIAKASQAVKAYQSVARMIAKEQRYSATLETVIASLSAEERGAYEMLTAKYTARKAK